MVVAVFITPSFRPELGKLCAFNKFIKSLGCKDLTPGCEDHFLHVFPPHSKSTASDTCDDFVSRIVLWSSCKAQFAEMLYARNLVSRCAVILCIFASMMIWGLNSLGTIKSGV